MLMPLLSPDMDTMVDTVAMEDMVDTAMEATDTMARDLLMLSPDTMVDTMVDTVVMEDMDMEATDTTARDLLMLSPDMDTMADTVVMDTEAMDTDIMDKL